MRGVASYFFREKPCVILLFLLDNDGAVTVSKVQRNVDAASSYVFKLITDFHKKGLLTGEKVGREKILRLTVKGKNLALCVKSGLEFLQ